MAAIIVCNGVDFIFFKVGDLPGRKTPGDQAWQDLPSRVQATIIDQFQLIFGVSNVERTPSFLASFPPIDIEIEANNHPAHKKAHHDHHP